MMRTTTILVSLASAALVAAAPRARGQSLAQRIASAPEGRVQFHFTARPGVCGDGRSFIALGQSLFMGSSMMNLGDSEWRAACVPGPVRVVLTRHGHDIERLRTYVGDLPPRTPEVADLGGVSTQEATAYLLSLAEHLDGSVSEHAILPAVLADSVVVWPRLLTIARDSMTRPHSTRQTAAFWLGRFAAAAITGRTITTLDDRDDDDDTGVRAAAVFGLSQLEHHAGIPPLIQVAETNRSPRIRDRAIFWLSQSDDARALAFFERTLERVSQ